MMTPGLFHTLTVADTQPQGLYLSDDSGERVLLPNRFVPEGIETGSTLEVFIYLDSDDRLIATTQRPRVQLNQAASLMVKDVNRTGAFLDWGLPKDLFVPFAEQKQRMEAGQSYVVYVTSDNTGRLIGTTRLNRFIKDEASANWPGAADPYQMGDKVKLLIAQRTDIGYKAIVDNTYWGVLHNSQIHKAIRVGQKTEGFIRQVREDQRLDLSLEPIGHQRADSLSKRILQKLKDSGGTLGLNDYSPAELIEMHFGVSKRAFKMAVGKLYKEREIIIEENGIRLASEEERKKAIKHAGGKPDAKKNKPKGQKANNRKPEKHTARKELPNGSKDDSSSSAPRKKTVYRNPKNTSGNTLRLKK
ncbi:MAG: S1-like domain-containing RNA-binding protein [Pseudomonadota bacterium]|nr:S1-like domain-containing RNA-binding protein [Pseudomonadota bacterium]